jgi:hypothetical protein
MWLLRRWQSSSSSPLAPASCFMPLPAIASISPSAGACSVTPRFCLLVFALMFVERLAVIPF